MKVGITGIANGGKTIFLTSLLWHLTELESSNFSLSKVAQVGGFRAQNKNVHKDSLFPFESYREQLANANRWPAKTKASYEYNFSLKRKNLGKLTRLRKLQLTNEQNFCFYDFPGERIADAAIAAFDSFEDWSEHILHHFQSLEDYRQAVTPYLSLLENLTDSPNKDDKEAQKEEQLKIKEELIDVYKLTLAKLIHKFKPLISPSTFLLDEKYVSAPMLEEKELAASRFSGLSKDTQFVPLSKEVVTHYPEIAKEMKKYYDAYRKQLALPLFKKIIQSQRLIILLDIPSLLMGGVGRYNDNRQILLDLFDVIEPNGFMGELLHKLQNLLGFGLEKIAFVAVKSDLVRPEDVISGRLESLLRQMTLRVKNKLPDVECGFFVCSALHSTRTSEKNNHLIGRPARNNPHNAEMEFEVSPLPEVWPNSWEIGDYRFMDVSPNIPKCLMIPPSQVGLDRIFEFLITEKGDI